MTIGGAKFVDDDFGSTDGMSLELYFELISCGKQFAFTLLFTSNTSSISESTICFA